MSEHSDNAIYKRKRWFSPSRESGTKGGSGTGWKKWNSWNKWNNEPEPLNKKKLVWGILLFIAGVFMLWVIKQVFKEALAKPAVLDSFYTQSNKQPIEKVKGESKGETLCRTIACKVFGRQFTKIRPDFLRNQVTDKNLELDIFNEDIKVAIEFNGEQHYKYIPFFHKNYEAFLNQRYRDEMKKGKCKEEGIHLIEIPYTVKLEDIESFIRIESKKLGYDV